MFSSEEGGMLASHQDADGAYLIDRNPKYFEPILNYLRTGRLIVDHNVNVEGQITFVFIQWGYEHSNHLNTEHRNTGFI